MPGHTLRLALAQLNFTVGAVAENTQRVIDAARRARDEQHADVVLFPELTLSGYPPEDLLFHAGLRKQVAAGLARVCGEVSGIDAIVGYPEYTSSGIYNSAAFVRGGAI